jgi:hypothetical protein
VSINTKLKSAVATIALLLPVTASAEWSQEKKVEVFSTILMHSQFCEAPHSDYINQVENMLMKEKGFPEKNHEVL